MDCYTIAKRGRKLSMETRQKLSAINKAKGKRPPVFYGMNHPNYRPKFLFNCQQCGVQVEQKNYRRREAKFCSRQCAYKNRDQGKTLEHERIRKSKEYALWRVAVLTRDDYTCQSCNKKGGELHADHIKPFALYPELRLAIDNGRTLCVKCHYETPTHGFRRMYRKDALAVGQEA